jgi:hypothetical protein
MRVRTEDRGQTGDESEDRRQTGDESEDRRDKNFHAFLCPRVHGHLTSEEGGERLVSNIGLLLR